ncbi:MAG TPA: hypothetical protein DCS66_18680, partial [Flavobacteriaceae bacterium]|nr:hypothetical protein [Flavobacteriaceae bacterium]
MNILHINTNDQGGAATAITRIHLGLLKQGVDSKILFLHTRKEIPESFAFKNSGSFFKRLSQKMKGLFSPSAKSIRAKYPNLEWFSNPTSPYDITEHPLYKAADIIQLNWVSGFLDEPSFFRKNTKPVVWRMPDLYACGGGYHYEKGFPFLELKGLLDKNEKIRKAAISNANITFVPISEWVKKKAEESCIISSFPKQVIHNGLDFSSWKPWEKEEARKYFEIPFDKRVILMGAALTQVERKGFQMALNAIQKLNNPDVITVVFGNYKDKLPKGFMKVGKIDSDVNLIRLYSAADYFLMPSIEEAFGQVTIEALACGLPVISFPNGGSRDILKPNVNGVLASDFTEVALLEAMKNGLSQSFDSEKIIGDVKHRFNNHDKVEAYYQLYQQLL